MPLSAIAPVVSSTSDAVANANACSKSVHEWGGDQLQSTEFWVSESALWSVRPLSLSLASHN